jgi:FkbM family methyltransferase
MPKKSPYYSQYGQDQFLDTRVFRRKLNGFFVDIGANDGITYSNTYFFEKERKWGGICVEPHPNVFEKLKQNRNCVIVNKGISKQNGVAEFVQIDGYAEMLSGIKSNYHQEHLARIDNEIVHHGGERKTILVECQRLDSLLADHNIDRVDYCSVDIEGGETEVLESLDLRQKIVRVFTIENNYADPAIPKCLRGAGYRQIARLKCDEIYELKKSFFHFLRS